MEFWGFPILLAKPLLGITFWTAPVENVIHTHSQSDEALKGYAYSTK